MINDQNDEQYKIYTAKNSIADNKINLSKFLRRLTLGNTFFLQLKALLFAVNTNKIMGTANDLFALESDECESKAFDETHWL